MSIKRNDLDGEGDELVEKSQYSIISDEKETDEEGYQRRFRSKQREALKRQREDSRMGRDDMERIALRKQNGTDKRAQEKLAKRGLQKLQQVANSLDLKQLMKTVTQAARCNCWGPEVASDKRTPNLALYVNYLEPTPSETTAPPPHKRFGVWLFFVKRQVHLAVAEQSLADDNEQWRIADPPAPANRLLSIEYKNEKQESIKSQIEAAILNWEYMPD